MKEAMMYDPVMFWQAATVLAVLVITTVNNIINPARK